MNKYFIFISILLFASCSDFLEKTPLDSPSDKTFLANETEINMAVVGCYTDLWTDLEGMPFYLAFEELSDNGWDRNTSDVQKLSQGANDAKSSFVETIWKTCYSGIARCNYLINNMAKVEGTVSADVLSYAKAQAQFLRAYYYSYLVEMWGDVPLVLESLTLADANIGRSPKADVLNQIFKDYDEAAAVLTTANKPTSGRPTKQAALALKARTALYNEKWDVAIAAASEVMKLEGSDVILDPSFSNLFTYEGQDSKEILFSIQYLFGQKVHPIFRLFGGRNGGGHANKIPSYQLVDSYECLDGLAIDKSPLYNPAKPWDNRDPRLAWTFALPSSGYSDWTKEPGCIFQGFQFETHRDSIKCWNYHTNTRVDNQDALNAYASFSGINWRKYVNDKNYGDVNNCDNNIIVIRYAEVLLIYAEAKIKAGQADASVYAALNKIRTRAGMPAITETNPDELFYAIARERRHELSGEGQRLSDIRRWKIAEKVMNGFLLGRMQKSYPSKAPVIDKWGTPDYEAAGIPIASDTNDPNTSMRTVDKRVFNPVRDYLWPIPYIERKTNPNLTQNPNYE
ncbi:RagB/SusD family nutrient uptake outer membrane protein [Parabacteroides sp. Marseille-P3160]|uniref:RagB/SusD family nutrient uptake outer membrane protein n=1 Tax=Parabacteroides sp. Marseille-P3160 TaxID=1917887 RepID=UPI0009BBE67D|nr:RagB/SusD family nutrient uptake outer membrane protein [Parabacteroides sp. Marseille-P3160]